MVVWGGRGDGVRDGEIGRGGAVRVGGLGVGVCGGRATSKTDRTGHRNGPNWLRKAGAAELAVWGCAIRAIIALPKGGSGGGREVPKTRLDGHEGDGEQTRRFEFFFRARR